MESRRARRAEAAGGLRSIGASGGLLCRGFLPLVVLIGRNFAANHGMARKIYLPTFPHSDPTTSTIALHCFDHSLLTEKPPWWKASRSVSLSTYLTNPYTPLRCNWLTVYAVYRDTETANSGSAMRGIDVDP